MSNVFKFERRGACGGSSAVLGGERQIAPASLIHRAAADFANNSLKLPLVECAEALEASLAPFAKLVDAAEALAKYYAAIRHSEWSDNVDAECDEHPEYAAVMSLVSSIRGETP